MHPGLVVALVVGLALAVGFLASVSYFRRIAARTIATRATTAWTDPAIETLVGQILSGDRNSALTFDSGMARGSLLRRNGEVWLQWVAVAPETSPDRLAEIIESAAADRAMEIRTEASQSGSPWPVATFVTLPSPRLMTEFLSAVFRQAGATDTVTTMNLSLA